MIYLHIVLLLLVLIIPIFASSEKKENMLKYSNENGDFFYNEIDFYVIKYDNIHNMTIFLKLGKNKDLKNHYEINNHCDWQMMYYYNFIHPLVASSFA